MVRRKAEAQKSSVPETSKVDVPVVEKEELKTIESNDSKISAPSSTKENKDSSIRTFSLSGSITKDGAVVASPESSIKEFQGSSPIDTAKLIFEDIERNLGKGTYIFSIKESMKNKEFMYRGVSNEKISIKSWRPQPEKTEPLRELGPRKAKADILLAAKLDMERREKRLNERSQKMAKKKAATVTPVVAPKTSKTATSKTAAKPKTTRSNKKT